MSNEFATTKLFAEVDVHGQKARTVRSAARHIIAAFCDVRWYGPDHPSFGEWVETIETMCAAITETTGERRHSIIERLDESIERSFTRRERESAKTARMLGLDRRFAPEPRNF